MEGIGRICATVVKFGPNMRVCEGNMFAKFEGHRTANEGVMGPYIAPGSNFGKGCGLWPNGFTDLHHFWKLDTAEQQQPHPEG